MEHGKSFHMYKPFWLKTFFFYCVSGNFSPSSSLISKEHLSCFSSSSVLWEDIDLSGPLPLSWLCPRLHWERAGLRLLQHWTEYSLPHFCSLLSSTFNDAIALSVVPIVPYLIHLLSNTFPSNPDLASTMVFLPCFQAISLHSPEHKCKFLHFSPGFSSNF